MALAIEQRVDRRPAEENGFAEAAALQMTGPDPIVDGPLRAAEHPGDLAERVHFRRGRLGHRIGVGRLAIDLRVGPSHSVKCAASAVWFIVCHNASPSDASNRIPVKSRDR